MPINPFIEGIRVKNLKKKERIRYVVDQNTGQHGSGNEENTDDVEEKDFSDVIYLFQQVDKSAQRPFPYAFTRKRFRLWVSMGLMILLGLFVSLYTAFFIRTIIPNNHREVPTLLEIALNSFPKDTDSFALLVALLAFQATVALAIVFESGKERINGSLEILSNLSLFTSFFTAFIIGFAAPNGIYQIHTFIEALKDSTLDLPYIQYTYPFFSLAILWASIELLRVSNIKTADIDRKNNEWKDKLKDWQEKYYELDSQLSEPESKDDKTQTLIERWETKRVTFWATVIEFVYYLVLVISINFSINSSPHFSIKIILCVLIIFCVLLLFFSIFTPLITQSDVIRALAHKKISIDSIILFSILFIYHLSLLIVLLHTYRLNWISLVLFVLHVICLWNLLTTTHSHFFQKSFSISRTYLLNKDLKQMRKEIEYRRREEEKEREQESREQESYILQEDMRKLQKQLTNITNLLQTQNVINQNLSMLIEQQQKPKGCLTKIINNIRKQ